MSAEAGTVGDEFLQHRRWVPQHLLGQEAVGSLIPRRKGGDSSVRGRVGWGERPRPGASRGPHGGRRAPGLGFRAELRWRLPFTVTVLGLFCYFPDHTKQCLLFVAHLENTYRGTSLHKHGFPLSVCSPNPALELYLLHPIKHPKTKAPDFICP